MDVENLPVLEGAAVRLRPIADADTDLIVKWRNTPSVVQNFIFRQTFTPEMHRRWLATKVATGQVVQYIIIDKADDKPVGSVYYRDIDNHNRSAEYGIFIGEESARGKGLGTETAKLFTDFGWRRNNDGKSTAKNPKAVQKDPQRAVLPVGGSCVPCGGLLYQLPYRTVGGLAAQHNEQR